MSLNLEYEAVAKDFVEQYYAMFDDPEKRANVLNFYDPTDSFMTFEGLQVQGATKILEKIQSLNFRKINREISIVDSQPTFDGGVLVNVMGKLQCDKDPPHAFSQLFLVKVDAGNYLVCHEFFRLNTHNST